MSWASFATYRAAQYALEIELCFTPQEEESARRRVALLQRLDSPFLLSPLHILPFCPSHILDESLLKRAPVRPIFGVCCVFPWIDTALDSALIRRYDQTTKMANIQPVLKSVATALDYLHSRGLVHGHVKPSHIFMNKGILGGFNLLFSADSADQVLVGTPFFFAPELFDSPFKTDKSDMFALGCVALLMSLPHSVLRQHNVFRGTMAEVVQDGRLAALLSMVDSKQLSDFIFHLLDPNVQYRYSAKKALSHPFLQQRASQQCVQHSQSTVQGVFDHLNHVL